MNAWLKGIAAAAALVSVSYGWQTTTPESEGFSTAKLDAMWTKLDSLGTSAFVVIRHDRIAYQRYSQGYAWTKPHYAASMCKALVGGMSLMIAMDEGYIRPSDLASKYVPQWRDIPLRRDITVAELATHTSGLDDAEQGDIPHKRLTGWKGEFWKYPPLPPPHDPFTLARDVDPVIFKPGTSQQYSNPGMAMLAYCLTASLRDAGAPQKDLRLLMRERLMDPIGTPASEWSIGYGATQIVDGLPLVAVWGGGDFSPDATARIARLLLHQGNWDGKQIISRRVVEEATHWAGLPSGSGLGWWVNHGKNGKPRWSRVPGDMFYGLGAGHQFVMIVPSLDLIVVRNGDLMGDTFDFNEPVRRYVANPLMGAMVR